ncbi:MAG: ribose transport system ATP-binding protein [Parasphingorhabdus sp.]|jgi:ribose transport system ATP-binding protein
MNNRHDTALVESVESIPGGTSEMLSTFPGELYVKNAHKAFGVTKALSGCSFSANFGEIHAIVGGNGCGKSTLAKVLSGVLPLDSGKLSILGHHPTSPSEARKIGIATVFQEIMIADEATVLDNLFVGSDGFWTKTLSMRDKLDRAGNLMRKLADEEVDLLMPCNNLPLSMKAWITIARALLCDPKVLILDESSAALDFDSTERLFSKMRELRDQGTAIIIVTHRIAELIKISDRATVMRDGKDVGVLAKSEITEENLLGLMTGRSYAGEKSSTQAHKSHNQEVVLKTRNLKVWDDSEAVDFNLQKGEIVGITGLDGHGQDDFVRILAGVAPASDGYPLLKDSQASVFVPIRDLAEAKQLGVSFVSGDRKREGILPNMSIFENLLIPLYRSTSRVPGIRFIDWLGLSDVFDWEVERLSIKMGPKSNPITSLSGGNQQKVIIGRSFALHPKILVLNDPARGVDVDTKRDLYKHLREFVNEGNSVVYMSSELEEFIGFCSRVLVFRNGSVFTSFVDDEVEPVGILEGMFGRLSGSPNAPSSTQTKENPATAQNLPTETNTIGQSPFKPEPITGKDVTRVKIVDFDEADKAPEKAVSNMKISYFD